MSLRTVTSRPSELLGRHVGGRARAHVVALDASRRGSARPKSVRRTLPSPSSMTLAGFRSRCSTPFSCAAASPAVTWRAMSRALSPRQAPDAAQERGQVLPVHELHREEGVALGLVDVPDAADGRVGDLTRHAHLAEEALEPVGVAAPSACGRNLRATGWSSFRSSARYTSPIPPWPSRPTMR